MKITGKLRRELRCPRCSPHRGHNATKKRKNISWKKIRTKQYENQ